ncbi:MAG TPA: energy-coupling factor transporter transmembrane component T [Clostridia bacterium]|jgi:energy-coupling factor transport system permease protein|nr:energy-coupling factor transporter transmembrane component T [Clostridia bacterium]HQC68210.1 energy-coupling factor transporter transmembrane component T [Clostridia bacterium]
MPVFADNPYNPNPVTKLFATILFGVTVLYQMNIYFEWAAIIILSFVFYKNNLKKEAVSNIVIFGILCLLPNIEVIEKTNIVIKMFLMVLVAYRIFYFPVASGLLFIKTSDVGSIISSMDALKFPKEVSIPIAVMFRFFPSFREDRQNVKLAMKVRGIACRNPVSYLEYVTVPLLIMSSNISDDISKAAETKCIGNPIKKSRYIPVRIKAIDYIYAVLIIAVVAGGLIW